MVEHLPATVLRLEHLFETVKRRFRRYGGRQLISTALLCSGIAMVVYVGVSYSRMYLEQRKLMEAWEAQNLEINAGQTMPPDSGLTRLVIPRIGLDVIIVEGTSHHSLSLGPGHLSNTAMPGDPGNSVIAAHRDTFFRHVYELKPGDDIFIERGGEKYHYVVTGKRVVQPTDLSVVDPSSESRLTLITCYPIHFIGPAPERLIVFAKLLHHV